MNKISFIDQKYFINESKKTVVCLLTYNVDGIFKDVNCQVKGIAKCKDPDVFDSELGKRLALTKAQIKARKNVIVKLYKIADGIDKVKKNIIDFSTELINHNIHDNEYINSYNND